MSKQATTVTSSFPVASILTIVFVVLKLTHLIDWSWWWVLAPVWISAALAVMVLAICGIIIAALK